MVSLSVRPHTHIHQHCSSTLQDLIWQDGTCRRSRRKLGHILTAVSPFPFVHIRKFTKRIHHSQNFIFVETSQKTSPLVLVSNPSPPRLGMMSRKRRRTSGFATVLQTFAPVMQTSTSMRRGWKGVLRNRVAS
jgi:hypothetical protein